jgi:hypothetical protein
MAANMLCSMASGQNGSSRPGSGPRSLDALLPVLYLRGVSVGDLQEALTALLGPEAPNLSPGVIARLIEAWQEEHGRWQRRDLSARRYVYIWADGLYLQARMEPEAEGILVIIGATPEGKKELIGFHAGARESAQSWRELLIDLKARASQSPRNLRLPMALWGSGKQWTRLIQPRGINAAGFTRSPIFSASSRSPWRRRSRPTCRRSTTLKPRRRRARR